MLVWLVISQFAHGATFTTDTRLDGVDAAPGDGVCATAAGKCSLRAAVQETNALPGDDTILLKSGYTELIGPSWVVTDHLVIEGQGPLSSILLDNANANRFFRVDNAYLTLTHMGFTGASTSGPGAVVRLDATTGVDAGVLLDDIRAEFLQAGGGGALVGAVVDPPAGTSPNVYVTIAYAYTDQLFTGDGGGLVHAHDQSGGAAFLDVQLTDILAYNPGGQVPGLVNVAAADRLYMDNITSFGSFVGPAGPTAAVDLTDVEEATVQGSRFAFHRHAGGTIRAQGTAGLHELTVINTRFTTNEGTDGGADVQVIGQDATLRRMRSVDANSSASVGGSVSLRGGGHTTVISSSISGAQGLRGGGIGVSEGASLDLFYSTLIDNAAVVDGGGLFVAPLAGNVVLDHASVLDNQALGQGGNVFDASLGSTVQNSVLAGGVSVTAPATGDHAGTVLPANPDSVNFVGAVDPASSTGWAATDLTGTVAAPLDPMLQPAVNVADNVGREPMFASPLVDVAGVLFSTPFPMFDQLGQPLFQDGDGLPGFGPDIGAVEYQP